MKNIISLSGVSLAIVLLLTGLTGCQNGMKEYYERPDWIRGNSFEVLQEEGNYSQFLKGIELCGYRDLVDGKSIITVMAPNDEAFSAFLAQKGLTDISQMDSTELDRLIGFHLMYYAYSDDKLINFRPEEGDDVSDKEKEINAGMYYKHRTYSKDTNSIEFHNKKEIYVSVYHQERFLPVFSYKYFSTKQISPEKNYNYFFPSTPWSQEVGFNVANAAATEPEIITSNGYIHKIDRVLKPLNTIYDELKNREEFSDFLARYDVYSSYVLDEYLSREYGNGQDLYLHKHIGPSNLPLASIACEWPNTDYTQMTENSSVGYSIFAPTNEALNTFFHNYWAKGGYESLNSVSNESVRKLLFNCIYADDIAFPEEIERGDIINSYGTPISVNFDAVPETYRILCENGLLYGCEEVAVPAMFASITGPAYQYKNMSHYLLILNGLGDIQNSLWSDETRMISLMPDNDQITSAGITYNSRFDYLEQDGKALSDGVKKSTAYAHLVDLSSCTGNETELPSTGLHVFRNMSPDYTLYWYVMDGAITNSLKFNELLYPTHKTEEDIFVPFNELASYREDGQWSNGKSYSYSGSMFAGDPSRTTYKNFQALMKNNKIDESQPYSAFANLLDFAGLYSGESFTFTTLPCLMFIPVNTAVYEALRQNQIPGIEFDATSYADSVDIFNCCTLTDIDTLTYYIKNYFVPLETAGITNYPYLGWNEVTTKGLPTLNETELIDPVTHKVSYQYTCLDVVDTGDALTVRLMEDGQQAIRIVPDYHFLPFTFNDGGIHFIEKCF